LKLFLAFRLDEDETELALIRRKKMAELIAREKQLQKAKEHQEKVGAERAKILERFLTTDALSYLVSLKKREPPIGLQVEDILLHLIVYRGLRQTIEQIDVRYIERQIKGEGPKIKIQRDGETSDFSSYVRDAIRKGNNN
jgi:DNA-binding TFAR19-related protein (PDSD5 family)